MKLVTVLTDFKKILKYQMSCKYVLWGWVVPCRQTVWWS